MEDRSFKMLLSVIRFLQEEDLKRDDINTAVSRLLEEYDTQLTDEQKKHIRRIFGYVNKYREEEIEMTTIFDD